MDWDLVIERNGNALRRIVAVIAAIAEAGLRGQFTFFPGKGVEVESPVPAEKSKLSPAPTLPRHLHRAILRMIRPAEAAARRLVIVAAREITINLPPLPPAKPAARPPAVVFLRQRGVAAAPARKHMPPRRSLSLPLLDPLPRARPPRPPSAVPTCGVPRILFPGVSEPRPIRPWQAPSPDDPLDATRIAMRLAALSRALADLPGHARRFARWRARRDRALAAQRHHRTTPIRANRPRGLRRLDPRIADLSEVALDLHYFAREAQHDTS